MQRYDHLMFTPAVRAAQAAMGSADIYDARYARLGAKGLGPDEVAFVESRSTIYMATINETGWPYLQHRGGPAGFVRVLDAQTIGFADYRGNRQVISQGNLAGDDRVSLFAMDYARKARLKLQGRARMQVAADAPDLAARLAVDGQGRVERVVTIRIEAFDWNCPQLITPRWDQQEMTALIGPEMARMQARIDTLEAELAARPTA